MQHPIVLSAEIRTPTSTHPRTARPGCANADQLPADLIVPLVVGDISERAATDPDAGLSVGDVERRQSAHRDR